MNKLPVIDSTVIILQENDMKIMSVCSLLFEYKIGNFIKSYSWLSRKVAFQEVLTLVKGRNIYFHVKIYID